ncbi:MAG: hypothetical protein LR015_01095 [Verrucomicrobia bacterium]|nr:hypothetical protein [Verrucomicrobiota bacterium]
MDLHTRIVLNNLLLKREEGFAHVYHCEQEINAILGSDCFPFPDPPELPSTRKKPPRKAAKHPSTSEHLTIRSLRKDARGYLVQYEDANGICHRERTTSTSVVQTLAKSPGITIREISYLKDDHQP